MQLYAVKWPDTSVSLVYAANEEQLFWLVDAVDDPMVTTWAPLETPMVAHLPSAVDDLVDEEIDPSDPHFSRATVLQDPTPELFDQIRSMATPHLRKLLEEAWDQGPVTREAIREAIAADKLVPLPHSFEASHYGV